MKSGWLKRILARLWAALWPAPTPGPDPVPPDGGSYPPVPDPGNQPTPPDAGNGPGDALSPMSIVWLDPSPAAFKVTAKLKDVTLFGRALSWRWTHPPWPEWRSSPDKPLVVGNLWIIAKVKGRYYGATLEWLRADTTRTTLQGGDAAPIFVQCKREPLSKWRPENGDEVFWMVSTICRGGIKPGDSPLERSVIVRGVMP